MTIFLSPAITLEPLRCVAARDGGQLNGEGQYINYLKVGDVPLTVDN